MKHLKDEGMPYTKHLIFAWRLGLKLFLLSLTSLVHGIFPFIFTHTVSDKVETLANELDKRDHT